MNNSGSRAAVAARLVVAAMALGIAGTAIAATAPIALNPGVIAGKQLHLKAARDYAYCEIAPVLGTPPKVTAQFYNTTLAGDCPTAKFAAIQPKALAAQLGALDVYMNPTPQTARRHWVMDQLWVYEVGETVDFDGVKANWVATMSPQQMKSAVANPYVGVTINRKSQYLYAKGSKVFTMTTPDGKTYVMQSYATEVNPRLTFADLPLLAGQLQLPAGWTFAAKTLTSDLTIDPRKADGVAHIIRDNLHNVYQGCGFDAACNYAP